VTKGTDVSLWVLTLADRKTTPFGDVHSTGTQPNAVFSPDGRWVAYAATDGARATIFVEPDPPTGVKYQLFAKGGDSPHDPTWSSNGKELFYNPRSGGFEVATVTTQPSFGFGNATVLTRQFSLGPASGPRLYDITPDGKFVGITSADAAPTGAPLNASQIQVVLNWFEELKARIR
jgi:Tol biopolymer transport system component